jgi:addiction module RelB/DinJ family antitoxin
MTANSVGRARIDQRIKEEAAAVLAVMGLTVSDAFRLMMVRIARTTRDAGFVRDALGIVAKARGMG